MVAPLQSQPGRYISLVWDPSPDERVVGYVVYVGTQSGRYDQSFVVRNRTYFTYTDATPDRRYYFAVAAYAGGPVLGPRSEDVSGYGQATPAIPVSDDLAVLDRPSSLQTLTSTSGVTCTDANSSACSRGSVIAATEGSIDALAAIGDGRVLVVEDGRLIRVFDGRVLSNDAALVASRNVTFIGASVDPRVEQRSRIYVAEAERRDDGTRELRIVRYRDVQNSLGEPAVIVSGIQLPATGGAPFIVDSNGRIFLALPSLQANTTRSAAVVLGFESDGGALRYNRAASPIVAWAPSTPTAMAWDDRGEQLWLAGIEGGEPTVVRVPINPLTSADAWPRVPQAATSVSADRLLRRIAPQNSDVTSTTLLAMAPGGHLVRVLPEANEFAEVRAFAQEETTATTTDPQTKSTYVVTRLRSGGPSYIYKFDNQ